MTGLPAQHGDDVGDDERVPDHHHPAHAVTLASRPMQMPAQREPSEQVKRRQARQRDDHVATGQLRLERVRQDRHRRDQERPGVEHPAELIGADADEPDVVGARQRYGRDPDQRQRQADGQVLANLVIEPDLKGQQASEQPAADVSESGQAQVSGRPRSGPERGQPREQAVLSGSTSDGVSRHQHLPPSPGRAAAPYPFQVSRLSSMLSGITQPIQLTDPALRADPASRPNSTDLTNPTISPTRYDAGLHRLDHAESDLIRNLRRLV